MDNEKEELEKKNYIISTIQSFMDTEHKKIFSIYHQNFEIINNSSSNKLSVETKDFMIESLLQRKNVTCGLIRADNSFIRNSKGKDLFTPMITDENEFVCLKMNILKFKQDDLFNISVSNFTMTGKKRKLNYFDQQISFNLQTKKKDYFNAATQSKLLSVNFFHYNKTDIQKLSSLNEEYNEQLCSYKMENVKIKKFYENELKKMKNLSPKHTNYEDLHPEMIPPHQSFKILICISTLITDSLKHLQYEENELMKHLTKADIDCLKEFLRKYQVLGKSIFSSLNKIHWIK